MRILLPALALFFLTSPPIAPAQDDPPAAPPGETPGAGSDDGGKSSTTGNPDIPTGELKLLLFPLTKAELLTEAEAWRALVQAKLQEIANFEVAALQKNGGETDPNSAANLKILRDEKSALLARLVIAVGAYEEKGGDAEELRKYTDVVSGLNVDVTDVSATWSTANDWLTSKDGGIKWGLNLLKFLVILFVFWLLSKAAARFVRRAISENARISHLLKQFINRLVARLVFFIGLLVALSTIGFNVSALLALIGGGAFIIGFALQDTLGNFAAGMMLLIYRPFDVGDAVEVGGVNGKVDTVSLVTTTIRTFDNKVVLVPNKKVWGEIITNASASPERRVDLIFGIGYEDDIGKAQEIIESLVANHELVLEEPEPIVRVHELADSSVNFICRPWAKTPDYWNVYWDLTRAVKETFDREGISIPFPQQDIYLHKVETGNGQSIGDKTPDKTPPATDSNPTGAAASSPKSSDTTGISPNDGDT